MTGSALVGCGIRRITVDGDNRFFKVSGDFLVNSGEICLVRYCGIPIVVPIGNEGMSVS
jgi:hypothetical protein